MAWFKSAVCHRPTAMNAIQSLLLEMMKDFDWAMRKEGVKYYAAYGTALGVVRHKGFIPWDDDIDVFIFPKDVPAFEKAMELLSPEYVLQKPMILDWPDAFYKIKLDGSFVREGKYPDSRLNHGLFIDIFVLKGVPDSRPRRFMHDILANIYHGLDMMTGKCIGKPSRDPLQKFILLNIKFTGKLMDMLLDNEDSEWVLLRNTDWSRFRRRYFEDTVDMDFEDMKMMMPSGYDEMLTYYFGDYMTPPPEDQRTPHSVEFIPCEPPRVREKRNDRISSPGT